MEKPLIIITGASSGIGAATAQAFSDLGHPLLLLARRVERLHALGLPNTLCQKLDVTDRQEMIRAVKEAETVYGPTDCLINNAGVMLLGLMSQQAPEEWQRMLDVNISGVLNGIHAVLEPMQQRKSGTLINVSSTAGRKFYPNHTVYCGTKFGLHAISEGIRQEVAEHDIRVITIAPGAVETELLGHTTDTQVKNGYESWKEEIGGVLTAEDVVRAILFAYQQPQHVCIREVVLAATRQQP